jgi:hypothetical protein
MLGFLFLSFHGTLELQKQKMGVVAINDLPQRSTNGPVEHSSNHAFCYILPLLYKLLSCYVNNSMPLFLYYFLIICI